MSEASRREQQKTPAAVQVSRKELARRRWKKSVVICLVGKLGLSACNPDYFPMIKQMMEFPQFVGLIGGKKSNALYFVGYHRNKLLFLDPHYTQVQPRSLFVML